MSHILLALLLVTSSVGEAGKVVRLTLDQAVLRALERNKDILIEKKNAEAAAADVLSRWGAFDPLFKIESSYTDSNTPTASTFIESGTIESKVFSLSSGLEGRLPTGTFYDLLDFEATRTETDSPLDTLSPSLTTTLSFTIGQDLLKNFGPRVNMAQITVAKRTAQMSREQVEIVVSDTLLQVISTYWRLVAARRNLDLAKTALDLALDLKRRNEAKVEVGVLPSVAVTQAEAEVAARRVDLIEAENALKAEEDRLKNLLSLPLDVEVVPVDAPVTVEKKVDLDQAIDTAVSERPEVVQAKLDLKRKRVLKGFYSNQRLPSLSVQTSLTLNGLGGEANPNRLVFDPTPPPIADRFASETKAIDQLFGADFVSWQVVGVLSIPLYNATAKADYRRSMAELGRSEYELERVVDNVRLDVRNAVREVENGLRRIEAADVAVRLAEEVLRNEEEKLAVGVGTTREVLEAQRDLVRARAQKIGAVADYNIALARLERAMGTLLDARGIEVE